MDLLFEADGKLGLQQARIGSSRDKVDAEWPVSARTHRVSTQETKRASKPSLERSSVPGFPETKGPGARNSARPSPPQKEASLNGQPSDASVAVSERALCCLLSTSGDT